MSDPNDDFIMPPDEGAKLPAAKPPPPKPPPAPVVLPSWAHRIVAFDTETTGTDDDARILEFGAVLWEDGVKVVDWAFFVNPGSIDTTDARVVEALGVNGLTVADIATAPTFAQNFWLVRHVFHQAAVRVAHNARFDQRMLQVEITRCLAAGTIKPSEASLDEIESEHKVILDTMALDIVLNPSAKGRGLASVAERWGVGDWHKHRAKGDAYAAGRILLAMAPKLPHRLEEVLPAMRQAQIKHDEAVAARRAEAAAKGGGAK